jgi:YesN/AraC family two-component response regulator
MAIKASRSFRLDSYHWLSIFDRKFIWNAPVEAHTMYKLLVADDEYKIRTGISEFMPWGSIGFEVTGQFENGLSVLEFLKNNHADVIFCDICMPIMNGIELARELYKYHSKVKIVLLSGYREFEYARQAMEYGVKEYIVKPIKYDELIKTFTRIREELDSEKDRNTSEEPETEIQGFSQQSEIIETIKSYIDCTYDSATLEEAAKLVYMNPYYLGQYFKQKTGENFSEYLTKVKMNKAASLLKNIAYKTYDVSNKIGYRNPKNFARAFKRFYGISPSEFRNKK